MDSRLAQEIVCNPKLEDALVTAIPLLPTADCWMLGEVGSSSTLGRSPTHTPFNVAFPTNLAFPELATVAVSQFEATALLIYLQAARTIFLTFEVPSLTDYPIEKRLLDYTEAMKKIRLGAEFVTELAAIDRAEIEIISKQRKVDASSARKIWEVWQRSYGFPHMQLY